MVISPARFARPGWVSAIQGMRNVAGSLVLVAATANLGCRPSGNVERAPESVWFEDATRHAGIDFRHQRGPTRYWLPEIMSGGGGWLDYDADGKLDLYLVQAGDLDRPVPTLANRLFHNIGQGRFEDVTDRAGVGDTGYGMGLSVGDYDGDGLDDLYVTNVGPNVLYRNRGDGTFENVTDQAGVGDQAWGTSAAFVDYDLDGDEDLFVVNYIRWSPDREIDCRTGNNLQDYCSPTTYQAPAVDTLFRNEGDGTFTNVTRQAGIAAAFGNGLGVTVGDFNGDGRMDFYVANDGTPNQLWIQQSHGTFRDEALLSGCSVNRVGAAEAGMGVAAVDIENDGDLDLFMSHLGTETNTLYVNDGGLFDDQTAIAGLAAPSVNFTGFGLGFYDFDHDGFVDLFVANGRVGRNLESLVPDDEFAEPNLLFRGNAGGRFEELKPDGGTWPALVENSRAAAFADYDNDGDIDVLVVNNNGPPRLLRNHVGEKGNWIRFRLINQHGLDAIGARIRIQVAGQAHWRNVTRAASYLSSQDPQVHFGLGAARRVDQVTVIWPGGGEASFGSQQAGQMITLRQTPGRTR